MTDTPVFYVVEKITFIALGMKRIGISRCNGKLLGTF